MQLLAIVLIQRKSTLCAKCFPFVKHSHNTKECCKWNSDGTPQKKDINNYYGKGSFSNTEACNDKLKQCIVQMKKEQKALKKLILKQGKRAVST